MVTPRDGPQSCRRRRFRLPFRLATNPNFSRCLRCFLQRRYSDRDCHACWRSNCPSFPKPAFGDPPGASEINNTRRRGWARIALHRRCTWFETRPGFAGTLLTMTKLLMALHKLVIPRRLARRGLEGRTALIQRHLHSCPASDAHSCPASDAGSAIQPGPPCKWA